MIGDEGRQWPFAEGKQAAERAVLAQDAALIAITRCAIAASSYGIVIMRQALFMGRGRIDLRGFGTLMVMAGRRDLICSIMHGRSGNSGRHHRARCRRHRHAVRKRGHGSGKQNRKQRQRGGKAPPRRKRHLGLTGHHERHDTTFQHGKVKAGTRGYQYLSRRCLAVDSWRFAFEKPEFSDILMVKDPTFGLPGHRPA